MARSISADLIVVGGGAGGLAAAFHARFRGASVIVVQDGPPGGECTFTGCVPSKALLAAARSGATFDDAMGRVRSVVAQIAGAEDASALAERGIKVVDGWGELTSGTSVTVNGTDLRAKAVVLSPGSSPMVPPIPGLGETPHLTNDNLFELTELPDRLAIIGGGPIGCEMAQAFADLGSKVVLFEGADRLLPRDDKGASAVVQAALEAQSVVVRVNTFVESVKSAHTGVIVTAGGEAFPSDQVLVATGRTPSFGAIGEVAMTDSGWIDVDEHLKTNLDGVYAVGDAVGSVQLTHAAARMASVAVDNALGSGTARLRKRVWDPAAIGWVTFTDPEVAQIGVTEAEAVAIKGARVSEVSMNEVDRAIAVGRTDGFIKLIAAPRKIIGNAGGGRLIGATVVAERAGELAGELALACGTGMFTGRLAQAVHPYPTWSMAVSQAASQFFTDAYSGRRARKPIG
jgi:pyruvate/2-oxoglutarate dehydrogenase complex dihydrolipoamide dehydrogenase (E3) component